jgi:hypothetical protein
MLLPALFATVAPPSSHNVPLTVEALAFGITAIASIAAWSAQETFRVHLNDLGESNAPPADKAGYESAPAKPGGVKTAGAIEVDSERRMLGRVSTECLPSKGSRIGSTLRRTVSDRRACVQPPKIALRKRTLATVK